MKQELDLNLAHRELREKLCEVKEKNHHLQETNKKTCDTLKAYVDALQVIERALMFRRMYIFSLVNLTISFAGHLVARLQYNVMTVPNNSGCFNE